MKAMKTLILVLLLMASTVIVAQDEAAEDEEACQLSSLFNAWARPSPPAAPNGAVFGQLVHIGEMQDTLVSASSDVAEAVELHEMVIGDGDVMQMRPVEDGFMIPPNSFLDLKPGGLHIMLIGLTQELAPGEQITLTLTFKLAGDVVVTVPVKDMTAMGDMSMEMEADSDMEQMLMPPMDWGKACAALYFLDPWARPAIPGAPNSAAYGLLLNLSGDDEMLVSASTDIAETVELHEMVMGDGDVMQMRPVEGGIPVPAGGATLLQPGGLHIMLINLTSAPAEGDRIDFTLSFAESEDLTLSVPVRQPGMGDMGGMDHGEDDDS